MCPLLIASNQLYIEEDNTLIKKIYFVHKNSNKDTKDLHFPLLTFRGKTLHYQEQT